MIWTKVIIEFVLGCGLLWWGANRFISSSIVISRKLGLPTLIVGMVFVGFGTSFPELVVSAVAAFQGNPDIAIGNAVGSNITNIGLVVGLTALIAPLSIHSRLLKREFPVLLIISVAVGLLLLTGYLSRLSGVILFVLLILYFCWIFLVTRRRPGTEDALTAEFQQEMPAQMKISTAIVWWIIGLGLLFVSSELLVNAAIAVAEWFKVSDLVIGLTIVAFGTSLPELAITIVSALRKEYDIAIGNVVGSNIFNLLAVLLMPALISPGRLPASLIRRDYPIMLIFTVALWAFAFSAPHKGRLSRLSSAILLIGYISYILFLIYQS